MSTLELYDPWADVSERYPAVVVERCALYPLLGAWVPSERVILVDESIPPARQDLALAHEIAHMDLGHRSGAGEWQETEADRLAARRMMLSTNAEARS